MKSAQARVVDIVLRATHRRDGLAEKLDGLKPITSAPPARGLARVASVGSLDRDGRTVWQFAPMGEGPDAPAVLFLHGGAYIGGFDPYHWKFLGRLMRGAPLQVWAPDYPLAPAHDAEAVVAWTLELYRELLDRQGEIVVMGDSAGGGLALSLAVAARDAGLALPRRLVLLSPWLDVTMSSPHAEDLDAGDLVLSREALLRCGAAYAGAREPSDPLVSPLFADLGGMPPTTVYCGTADQLIADARRLRTRAREEYPEWSYTLHECPGMIHDYMLVDLMPEARRSIKRIREDLCRP